MKKNILMLALLFIGTLHAQSSDQQFIDSFVRHYDFCKQGRYTHEYHPFLLHKAAASMDELESHLEHKGIQLHGRMVIAGYEEQAIPSYYTDFSKPVIIDEATQVSNAGSAAPPHNRFGLMTGFLFKDFNYFANKWWGKSDPLFEHINPDLVEIYEGRGTIFQKDAFGDLFSLLTQKQEVVEKLFFEHKDREILNELIDLWQTMYAYESKTGNKQIIGTQDILFSIEYARHLTRSKLPLHKYWTGGDITYPIEVSLIHKKEATRNAQQFVRTFVPRLQPINNEPTAYVFCSFVDGVGKSTMLGNVKNWSQFGDKIEQYAHVDNSSSQYAAKYNLGSNVFILDLPAQVSHFTYKPDGSVYVDINTLVQDAKQIETLVHHARDHKTELAREYYETVMALQGQTTIAPCESDPSRLFLQNVVLLKKQVTNPWVPFSKEGNQYLFNFFDISQIRMLVPLEKAPSHGLKNIEPEQMLFTQGVRFPISYQAFLDDLVTKMHESGIKHVMFVDFLSMYPRSCRENIRINYLLQQMAHIYHDFSFDQSIYADILDDSHLFYSVKSKGINRFTDFLRDETLVRLALYKIVERQNRQHLDGVPLAKLSVELRTMIDEIARAEVYTYLCTLTHEKMESEVYALEQTYGLTKEFVNIQQFSFEALQAFSIFLEWCFTQQVDDEDLNALWTATGSVVTSKEDVCNGHFHKMITLDNAVQARGLYLFWPECKSSAPLEPFFRLVRTAWYATLANLLSVSEVRNKKMMFEKVPNKVPPMTIKKGEDGKFYLVQTNFEPFKGKLSAGSEADRNFVQRFGLEPAYCSWGEYSKELYCMNWENRSTSEGLFAFDCSLNSFVNPLLNTSQSVVTALVKQYKEKKGQHKVMPASELYEELSKNRQWHKEYNEMLDRAIKSAQSSTPENEQNNKSPMLGLDQKVAVTLATPQQRYGAQLMVRALATLEMIVKDANADIVVRRGNKQDFQAALKLFEEVVLPKYFGVIFAEPLWRNYDDVEPCISWDVIGK